MPFDGCPHFAARDGRLYRVLLDGSKVLYWSPEEGRAIHRVPEVPEKVAARGSVQLYERRFKDGFDPE